MTGSDRRGAPNGLAEIPDDRQDGRGRDEDARMHTHGVGTRVGRCHSHACANPAHLETFQPSHQVVFAVVRGCERTSVVAPAASDSESDDSTTSENQTSHAQGGIVSVYVH